MERHFATIWEALSDAISDHTAVVQGARRHTWREFEDRAARLAGAFLAAGLGAGSKIALYLYNCPEYLEGFFAGLKVRAVPCNVNYRYLDDELLYLLVNSDAEAIVFHSSLGAPVGTVLEKASSVRLAIEVADDDAHLDSAHRYDELIAASEPAARTTRSANDDYMIYTGGTTGMPKGVITRIGPTVDQIISLMPPLAAYGTHEGPETLVVKAVEKAESNAQFASMPAAPLMHNTGFGIGATPALTLGGRIVLLEGRRFDPQGLWATVEHERVNAITIVGDAFRARPMLRALEHGPARDLSCVQIIASSGAMFSTEVKAGLLEHIPTATIVDIIASTEATIGLSVATAGALPPTGQFFPSPGVTVLDDDGVPVEAGSDVPGLLAVPGGAAEGYYKDNDKSVQTFRDIGGVRYAIPGDFATINADGTITLLGRGSACINTGGEKVFPEEVEELLKTLPDVEDCLIFGVPDERFGQRVVGVLSLSPDHQATSEDLLARVEGRLAPYKLPRQLAIVDETPRSPSGKPDYPMAREIFAEHIRSG